MYTVIRRYTGTGLREIVEQKQASLRETMAGVPGLQGYYFLMQGNNEIATITVCESRDGTRESNKRAAAWVKDNVPASANLSKPDVFEGETLLEVSPKHAMA